MATLTKYGSVKRFGVRYGRRVKEEFGKIEHMRASSSLCPFCRKKQMKRIASGIWECEKCNIKLAGGAYSVERIKLSEESSGEAKAEG
ncbi:50S ribosomal protein L37ae [Candidatus Woesearchaeota archaeon]|nr:50S ribosomal protein L37ae [Candidatus Woesearchaeota archaeon]